MHLSYPRHYGLRRYTRSRLVNQCSGVEFRRDRGLNNVRPVERTMGKGRAVGTCHKAVVSYRVKLVSQETSVAIRPLAFREDHAARPKPALATKGKPRLELGTRLRGSMVECVCSGERRTAGGSGVRLGRKT